MPTARQASSTARNPTPSVRGHGAPSQYRLRRLRRGRRRRDFRDRHSYSSRYLRTSRMLMKFIITVMTNSSAATANRTRSR